MNERTIPDITVEDLLKIIGDKEVQIARRNGHIPTLPAKIEELCNTPLPTPLKDAKEKAS